MWALYMSCSMLYCLLDCTRFQTRRCAPHHKKCVDLMEYRGPLYVESRDTSWASDPSCPRTIGSHHNLNCGVLHYCITRYNVEIQDWQLESQHRLAKYVLRTNKFYCLRQVHLAENLFQATHTQNREKTT